MVYKQVRQDLNERSKTGYIIPVCWRTHREPFTISCLSSMTAMPKPGSRSAHRKLNYEPGMTRKLYKNMHAIVQFAQSV